VYQFGFCKARVWAVQGRPLLKPYQIGVLNPAALALVAAAASPMLVALGETRLALLGAAAVFALQAHSYGRYLLPVYMITGAVVYLVMLRLLKAIRLEDIQLIKDCLGPRLTTISNILSIIFIPYAEQRH
jgi:hypothetical protein